MAQTEDFVGIPDVRKVEALIADLKPMAALTIAANIAADHAVHRELRAGEVLKWAGKPMPRVAALAPQYSNLALLGVVLVLAPILFFWLATYGRWFSGGFRAMAWFALLSMPLGIPVLLMMLAEPVGWLLVRSTIYGVTNQRIFIAHRFPRRVTHSWDIGATNTLDRKEKSNGWGSLVFHREVFESEAGTGILEHAFHGIPEVRKVEALIAELKRRAAE